MRILLVEDDEQLGHSLKRALESDNYCCDWVTSAESAAHVLQFETLDLIILDWMLPDKSGVQLLREIRRKAIDHPVMMLTANISTDAKVEGLDAGADDYLTKPFELSELLARVRALARRRVVRASNTLTCGPLWLDLDACELKIEEQTHKLSAHEKRVLQLLIENRGRYVSKTKLESYLSGMDSSVTSNAIEAQISRLRKKLGATLILTLRGVGYKLNIE